MICHDCEDQTPPLSQFQSAFLDFHRALHRLFNLVIGDALDRLVSRWADCGRCIDCIETDDYAPTWRNPRFQAATSTETRERDENVCAPALTVDGLTAALRALGRDGGESRG